MTALPSITQSLTLGAALKAGYQRILARLAGYKAAYPSPTTTVGSRYGTNSNSTVAQVQRVGMMFTAEDVAKNSPIGWAYILQRINYNSRLIRYIPNTGDEKLNEDLRAYLQGQDGTEGVWSRMGTNCSMQAAFSRTADIELPVRGDSGMVWHRDMMGNLKLMEFSADQLGEPYNYVQPRVASLVAMPDGTIKETIGNNLRYFAGRYFDADGECVAYKIYERLDSWYGNPRIFSAQDVLYFQDPASFRGMRGVTKFAAALQHMEKGEHLFQIGMDAALRQSKTAYAIFNERGAPDEQTYENSTHSDGRVVSRERINDGPLVEYFFNGDKVQATSADSPGPELIAGCEFSDERVAMALGTNYATLVSPKNVGGAPSRLEVNKWSNECERIKTHIHLPNLHRIKSVTILDAVAKGYFPANPNILNGSFQLPISPTVDAFYDAKENINNLRSGLESPQMICAERNRDWNDVLNQKINAATQAAMSVGDANKKLINSGYEGSITLNDVMQLADLTGTISEKKLAPPYSEENVALIKDIGIGGTESLIALQTQVATGIIDRQTGINTLVSLFGVDEKIAEGMIPKEGTVDPMALKAPTLPAKATLAAYMGDMLVADLPPDTRAEIARIMGTNGKTDALRVVKYGMVASELERMADPSNLEAAQKHLRYCTNGSCAEEVHANTEKHILVQNGRVIDGHHYLARALKGKVSKSLPVIDITPARFQIAA